MNKKQSMRTMQTLLILATVLIIGMISLPGISNAWHSEDFKSKKECVDYVKEVTRDTTRAEAELKCEEVIPH